MQAKQELLAILENSENAVKSALSSVREALYKKDLDQYSIELDNLKTRIDELNRTIRKVDYATFMESGTPIIAAVEQFFHKTVKLKENHDSENGTIIGVDIDSSKSRIDLKALCEFGELGQDWVIEAKHLLDLFVLRETEVFKMSPADILSKGNFFLNSVAAKKKGETPDSNTQMVKQLQKIVDMMIFVDNGEGKNKYKCTVHSLVFCRDCITKLDAKEKCTIATMKPRQFETVIMSVLAHVLGEEYKVKAPQPKQKKGDKAQKA